jgi:DNA-binding transcriptional ArsR family regulator
MVDIHTILADHRSKKKNEGTAHLKDQSLQDESLSSKDSLKMVGVNRPRPSVAATSSEIPDLFFDKILVEFKLPRIEIMVLMYVYRQVWCRPNLYKIHGISQLLSYTEMGKVLHLEIEEIYQALRRLEEHGFVATVRSGQYFVRRYFTQDLDSEFGQTYDDFDF